jgi:ABC-type transport system involved in cytochrome c biogenesis ATPase subunit
VSAARATMQTDYAIEMDGLTRRFGDFVAVDPVTLKIPKGQLYGFLGLNGAGKTTTIRMLTTLLPPTSGTAKLWGHDVMKEPLAVRKLVGLVSDETSESQSTWTAREYLSYFARIRQMPNPDQEVERILNDVGLDPKFRGKLICTYSTGMIRRGSDEQFANCYGPTWGRFKDRTRPAPGNHEYHSDGASGYVRYFGAAAGEPKKGYYSYDLGEWHIIVLNSECADVEGCNAGSAQDLWLRQDLKAHPAACTLAYWHKPLFSSGAAHGDDPEVKPLWDALYAANADVVIGGHDHHYERFAPQDPSGNPDPQRGIREFVVGTGGKNSHRKLAGFERNSEVRQADTFGVLKLTLHPTSYDWEFVPEAGKTFTDSGSGTCH